MFENSNFQLKYVWNTLPLAWVNILWTKSNICIHTIITLSKSNIQLLFFQRNKTLETSHQSIYHITTTHLCLVSDEVHLRFARLCGNWRWDIDFWSFFWFLDQNVYQGLLLILGLYWNDWCGWSGSSRCLWTNTVLISPLNAEDTVAHLDEDDLVVLLSLGCYDGSLRAEFFWFWWGNVHVDVLLHGGTTAATESATETASESTSAATAETWKRKNVVNKILQVEIKRIRKKNNQVEE